MGFFRTKIVYKSFLWKILEHFLMTLSTYMYIIVCVSYRWNAAKRPDNATRLRVEGVNRQADSQRQTETSINIAATTEHRSRKWELRDWAENEDSAYSAEYYVFYASRNIVSRTLYASLSTTNILE